MREQIAKPLDVILRELARYRAAGVTVTEDGRVNIPRRYSTKDRTIALRDDGSVLVWNGEPLLQAVPALPRLEALQATCAYEGRTEIGDKAVSFLGRDRETVILELTFEDGVWVETDGADGYIEQGRSHERVRDGVDVACPTNAPRVWPGLWEPFYV